MSETINVSYDIPAPPEGWEYAGVRQTECSTELYFNGVGWVKCSSTARSRGIYPVAVRSKRWRPATEADVGRSDARFSLGKSSWTKAKLIHVAEQGSTPFISWTNIGVGVSVGIWNYCEVPVLEDEHDD